MIAEVLSGSAFGNTPRLVKQDDDFAHLSMQVEDFRQSEIFNPL